MSRWTLRLSICTATMDSTGHQPCRIPVEENGQPMRSETLVLSPPTNMSCTPGAIQRRGRTKHTNTPIALVREACFNPRSSGSSVTSMIRRPGQPALQCPLASQLLMTRWWRRGPRRSSRARIEKPSKGPYFPLDDLDDKSNIRLLRTEMLGRPCGRKKYLCHVQQAACGYPRSNASSCHGCCATNPMLSPFRQRGCMRGMGQELDSASRSRSRWPLHPGKPAASNHVWMVWDILFGLTADRLAEKPVDLWLEGSHGLETRTCFGHIETAGSAGHPSGTGHRHAVGLPLCRRQHGESCCRVSASVPCSDSEPRLVQMPSHASHLQLTSSLSLLAVISILRSTLQDQFLKAGPGDAYHSQQPIRS